MATAARASLDHSAARLDGFALLDEARLLVLENGNETLCYKLDLDQLPGEPAPLWESPPPVEPQVIPVDDPKWVAELRKLPANRWIHPKVPRCGDSRLGNCGRR